jgi:hypothetical protein
MNIIAATTTAAIQLAAPDWKSLMMQHIAGLQVVWSCRAGYSRGCRLAAGLRVTSPLNPTCHAQDAAGQSHAPRGVAKFRCTITSVITNGAPPARPPHSAHRAQRPNAPPVRAEMMHASRLDDIFDLCWCVAPPPAVAPGPALLGQTSASGGGGWGRCAAAAVLGAVLCVWGHCNGAGREARAAQRGSSAARHLFHVFTYLCHTAAGGAPARREGTFSVTSRAPRQPPRLGPPTVIALLPLIPIPVSLPLRLPPLGAPHGAYGDLIILSCCNRDLRGGSRPAAGGRVGSLPLNIASSAQARAHGSRWRARARDSSVPAMQDRPTRAPRRSHLALAVAAAAAAS